MGHKRSGEGGRSTVAMDVGTVEGGGGEDDEWEEGHESDWVDAVYATTRCYYCQGYGHMARECPPKAKGKGAAKGGGKGATKGGVKGGQSRNQRRKWQGRGKGYGKGHGVVKGTGKGCGYHGQCWICGRIGHKSAECNVYVVGDVEQEAGVDVVSSLREEP